MSTTSETPTTMKCIECNGTGEIEVHSEMLMCPECFGKGEVKGKEIRKLIRRITALNNAIESLIVDGYNDTPSELIEIREEYRQQLKDAQFDQETNPLPFPEK
jgi:DnaJ-class molecular chaperone